MNSDFMKRVFDLVIAVSISPVAIIICAIAMVLYLVIEREWPIFSQRRIGFLEREFTIYKLRTMKSSTKNLATHQVEKSSVTTVGKFLRASKIDELPQLVNVILGDMSLVGPRPSLVTQEELRNQRRRLDVYSVKPGVTGLSQIRDIDMSDSVRLAQSDADYIRNISLAQDFRILLATVFGAGSGDRVQ